jgi:soluble lytic murein transglycosylase-like protein
MSARPARPQGTRIQPGLRTSAAICLTVLATAFGAALVCIAMAALFASTPCKAAELTPPPAAQPWRAELTRAAHAQWGLDAPIAALAAQVHQESGWNPAAVSRVGAVGMTQFMPATATWWCQSQRMAPADCQPTNPTWALRALVGYDKWLWDRVPQAGAPPDRLWAALRAYNGGLGHWLDERKLAAGPSRTQVDAACGRARRAAQFCGENLGYPRRILVVLQPRYSTWGGVLEVTGS